MSDLARFVRAQDDGGTYAAALAELRAGEKRSHWMWFVFPQLAGLGRGAMAQRYAIAGVEEAMAYLADPVLGARLVECAEVLTGLPGGDAVAVFGSIDALKLRSSMTLFARVAPEGAGPSVFRRVLERYFDGVEDPATVGLLGG